MADATIASPAPSPEAATATATTTASTTTTATATTTTTATATATTTATATLSLDKPVDLGPAGPLVATERGPIFRGRVDDLVGVALDVATGRPRIDVVPGRPKPDVPATWRGQPPAFTHSSHGYWVARGKLVRKAFDWESGASGSLEVLAEDALEGGRVAATTSSGRDVAIYIARPARGTDERAARLWVEGAGTVALSSEGSGASSVALTGAGSRLVSVMLDERAALSPVHARTIELDAIGPPRLGADTVVFVGPSPESHNEIAAADSPEGPFAFIPFARDTSSFGLASLFIGREPGLDAPVEWTMYPNGIEPAPVNAATFCDRTWVAYVRPSAASSDAPGVLVVAPLEKGGLGAEITAGQGFDFSIVSLAPRGDRGAWLAWVGNGRSWARGIRCG